MDQSDIVIDVVQKKLQMTGQSLYSNSELKSILEVEQAQNPAKGSDYRDFSWTTTKSGVNHEHK